MSRIHLLPAILVKKIAAGEVIERPASVVKELMENAIDAGATSVTVVTKEGGRSLICVADDGCGIAAAELPLAITPHATSKISDEDDLYRIGSMGFRGEALASIGAVSRLRILSRTHDSDEGGEIVVQAEHVQTNRAAGCSAGCSVEVRDLFFNLPARRKFLRQASTETGHVTTQFSRLALAHPEIAFELSSNGRTTHKLPANASKLERIGRLYGRELADTLIEFRRDESPVAIEGYAAPPAGSRSNTNWQFTFVNGRYIRDKYVQHAIREAYRGLIDPHRAPVVFLFLTVDPATVDVNVHPTKIEVRWQDSNMIHSQVLSTLREALQSADLTPVLDTRQRPDRQPPSQPDPASQDRIRRQFVDEMLRGNPAQPSPPLEPHRSTGTPSPQQIDGPPSALRPAQAEEVWRAMYRDPAPSEHPPTHQQTSESFAPAAGTSPSAIQLHNTYLVCETDDGMIIIDQHALHERVIYNQLTERIAGGKLESQRLLLPETLQVTPAQAALLESHADLLDQLGIEVTPFGQDTVAVQSFPALLKDADVVGFLRDLLDKLADHASQPHTELIIHELLDMMACKAAVKAGDPLTPKEIEALIKQKDLLEKSSNCPHGRPTTLRLTVRDLDRQFKR